MEQKENINSDMFIKDDFIIEKKYVEFDETPEVQEARNDQEKTAWREIYSFVHAVNKAGREWNDTDIKHQCERFYLSYEKVKAVFVKVFQQNKDDFGIDDKPEIYKVENFLRKNWDFVRNEVTQRSEYRQKNNEGEFVSLNPDSLFRKLQHVRFSFSIDKLKSLLRSDFVETYNPFIDYFEKLPTWNRDVDHIGKLANFVKTTDQDFHVSQFRKMLVRCVGCALYGVENRFVYVLVGEKQEKGKSTFIRFLNPFGTKYYTEAPIRDNKDTYFSFSENFIYNLEELASLSNIEVNHLKSIISMTTIKERKAYAVDAEEQPRRTNFFGSTNKNEFLTDTENTRWLCVNVEDINWNYKTEVDIHAVWAQAYALYHSDDYNQQLTSEEMKSRDLANKGFEISDLEKDLIKQCFEITDATGQFYSLPDIISTLSEKFNGKPLNSRFVGKSMAQLGFLAGIQRINGHKTRGYYVNLRTTSAYINGEEPAKYQKPEQKEPEQKAFKF
jgi:hypothetical protein